MDRRVARASASTRASSSALLPPSPGRRPLDVQRPVRLDTPARAGSGAYRANRSPSPGSTDTLGTKTTVPSITPQLNVHSRPRSLQAVDAAGVVARDLARDALGVIGVDGAVGDPTVQEPPQAVLELRGT